MESDGRAGNYDGDETSGFCRTPSSNSCLHCTWSAFPTGANSNKPRQIALSGELLASFQPPQFRFLPTLLLSCQRASIHAASFQPLAHALLKNAGVCPFGFAPLRRRAILSPCPCQQIRLTPPMPAFAEPVSTAAPSNRPKDRNSSSASVPPPIRLIPSTRAFPFSPVPGTNPPRQPDPTRKSFRSLSQISMFFIYICSKLCSGHRYAPSLFFPLCAFAAAARSRVRGKTHYHQHSSRRHGRNQRHRCRDHTI